MSVFIAEIKQVSSKKTASLDIEHRVIFATEDNIVTELSKIPGDQLVKVTVEVING